MAYKVTTATRKVLALKKRIRGVSGGTSASKTISILMWLIDYAQSTQNEVISVVSETLPHLKRGAIRDFLNIMQEHQYFEESRWNRTEFTYTFEKGSRIEFFSADQPSKVRGPRRQVLFINEANNIPLESFTQLEIRTEKVIWLDWNPVSEYWWYTDVLPNQDVDFITLTYKDNEALPQSIVDSIEAKQHNKLFWQVYGLGQLGDAEGRIYTGWQIIDDIPFEARLERRGGDFGYTNDPTAIIDIYTYNGGYIWDEICYRKGMSNKDIADVVLAHDNTLGVFDSSEPKSIDELLLYGVSVVGSQKGPGSVLQGIQYVQDQKISLTKRSTNTIKEYRNYLWLTDRDGKIINTPSDVFNHAMDAGRYGMESLRPTTANYERPNFKKWAIG